MNEYYILVVLMLFLPNSCKNDPSEVEILRTRCIYYDSIGYQYLNGYSTHNFGGNSRSSVEVTRTDSTYGRAIIKLKPEFNIEKNFAFGDTLDKEFGRHYKVMDCTLFYSDSIFTQCYLELQDSMYLLFKGDPSSRISMSTMKMEDARTLINDWRYFSWIKK